MSAKYKPYGEPFVNGEFEIQEERTSSGNHSRFRLMFPSGGNVVLQPAQLLTFTDLIDEVCDMYADGKIGAGA